MQHSQTFCLFHAVFSAVFPLEYLLKASTSTKHTPLLKPIFLSER